MPPVQERRQLGQKQLWGLGQPPVQGLGAGQLLYLYLCLWLWPPRLVQELLRGQQRRR